MDPAGNSSNLLEQNYGSISPGLEDPHKAPATNPSAVPANDGRVGDVSLKSDGEVESLPWWSRRRYFGALLFNFAAFILPAVYGTLSKMWIASLDSSSVATLDAYTYASIVVEVINEGLPRGVWSTTTDRTALPLEARLAQILTLITVQTTLGLCLTVAFVIAAPSFVGAFVPGTVRSISVRYVRISSGSLVASTLETAVSLGTRALDHPDVPLAISTVKTVLQICLELALISTVRIKAVNPTILTQATIRLICDILGAVAGLVYFLTILARHRPDVARQKRNWLSASAFKQLFRPGRWTFTESAIRNTIYLYQTHTVINIGTTYATAWGVFNTIRWGLIMVPVQALEATANTFVGHAWGAFSARGGLSRPASVHEVMNVVRPATQSVLIALIFEVPICLSLSFAGARPFARYLGGTDEVAEVTAVMWRTMDWMYICYAISTCLATILLATRPTYYLVQSLISNLCYALPWGIIVSQVNIDAANAWTYHKWMFGGSLVFSLADVLITDGLWAWALLRGHQGTPWCAGARLKLPRRMAWMRQLYVKLRQSL